MQGALFGTFATVPELNSFGLDAFADHLLLERRLSPATVAAYSSDLFFFVQYVQSVYDESTPQEIKVVHLRSWLAEGAEAGLSSRTLNRRLSALRTYFGFARLLWEGVPQPAVLLRGLKVPKRIVRVLKADEVEQLLDPRRFEAHWLGTRDRFLLLTLYALGIRRAELLQMRWADIDSSAQTVRILGKGNKERLLPALPVWLDGLEEYRRACETAGVPTDSVLFWESTSKKMTPKRVYSVVHSYLQRASSVEKASPHVLRHTFATHLLDMGADLASIRSLLGHANLSATQVYTHASIEQLKSVVQRAHPRGREGQRS